MLLMPAVARAASSEDVARAVERGVAFLKSHQNDDGTWNFRDGSPAHPVGVAGLAGLALIESGVPPSDPAVQKAAQVVRDGTPQVGATYELSLVIMFLDRLGEEADGPLIETAARRLVAGQSAGGGWTYDCPISTEETATTELKTRAPESSPQSHRSGYGSLQVKRTGRAGSRCLDDNSNTQFAVMALWIARRHHLPVESALSAVDRRFRRSQRADGGWGYQAGNGSALDFHSTAAMTCSALLGLSVGEGVAILRSGGAGRVSGQARPALAQDSTVQRGFAYLARVLDRAMDPQIYSFQEIPNPNMVSGIEYIPKSRGGVIGNPLGSEFYFLWSLERVAVVYGLKNIGHRDWFEMGAGYLVRTQDGDGSWSGNPKLGRIVGTCFALYFLRRANLARDLTVQLKNTLRGLNVAALKAEGTQGPGEAAATAPSTEDPLVRELRHRLVTASPIVQSSMIDHLRDNKGGAYTATLATAIPLLEGAMKQKARDGLAERLARMTEKRSATS